MERNPLPPSLLRPISRRDLLGASLVAGLGATAFAAGIIPQETGGASLLHTAAGEKPTLPKEHGLPEDVLTEEQLKALNITVNQTKDVQLHIRKSAIDELKIFQDIKEGKIGGVVISLIDNDVISWNSIDQLPPDARLMWQTINLHPAEWPEERWADMKRYLNEMTMYLQDSINGNRENIDKINSGEKEAEIIKFIKLYEDIIQEKEAGNSKYFTDGIDDYKSDLVRWNKQLADLKSGKLLQDEQKGLAENQDNLKKNSVEVKIVENKSERVSYFAARGDTAIGQFINPAQFSDVLTEEFDSKTRKRRSDYIRTRPDWMGKVYIYVCVGGNSKPALDESFPVADQFENSEDSKSAFGYHVWEKSGEPHQGFTIRHEIGHYVNNFPQQAEDEAAADDFGIQTIEEATRRNAQGDNTGYYFIFSTKEGVIYTKKYRKASEGLSILSA